MAQNLRDEQQAAKDWMVDRLPKMDRAVFSRLQAASEQCTHWSERPTLLTIGEGSGADAQKKYLAIIAAWEPGIAWALKLRQFLLFLSSRTGCGMTTHI